MNNDLEKEAVVDTGNDATAMAKKKNSGQAKKSSGAKNSTGKKKSAQASNSEKTNVKKSSNSRSENTANSPAKKSSAKTSHSTAKTQQKKSAEKNSGGASKPAAKKSDSQSPQETQHKKKTAVKTVLKYSEEEDSVKHDIVNNDDYSEEDLDEKLDSEFEDDYEDENSFDERYEEHHAETLNADAHGKATDDKKNEKKKRRPLLIAIPIVTAAAILTTGVIVSSAALGIFDSAKHEAFVATEQSNANLSSPQGKFLEGISVQGVDLGGKTMEQAKELLGIEESKLIPSINYNLTCYDKIVYLTEDDFEFDFDTVKILNEAYEYSEYMREILMDKGRANLRESEKKDYPISMKFNEDSIRTACEKVAEKVNVEMENAHVTNIDTEKDYLPDMFSFAEGVTGYSVDVDDLVTQISTLKNNDNFSADIIGQMKVVEPKTDLEDLLKNLVLISKYETYSGNTWAGNMNMTVAMQSMTGSVIKPGEVFSFNGKTGDSNLPENGYYSAGVIVNGASANGVGGGICQAATTIYNAAIRAGMTIVEREPHTWPSTYVPVGIDSAIDYGAIDMKFRNDTEHEVYLICYMDGATLHAYIYGYKPADFDEIVVSSWFTGGTGIGFGASACRNYYKNGKIVKTEDLPDSFYSNGGGSSYAYDEPLANYVFERVYTDKQAAKIAAKVEEETKNKSTKNTTTSDTDKETEKEKSSDKDTDTSDSTATNDIANTTITGGVIDETVTANAVIEDYTAAAVVEDTTVYEDIVYSDESTAAAPVEDIPDNGDSLDADFVFDDLEEY